MKKVRIIFVVLWGVGLALLFLAASTNLIFDDSGADYYRISVVWDDVTEDYVENYKNNISKYTELKNIEYRFLTMEEPLDVKQQMELLLQEEQGGADLLVVKPLDEEKLEELLEESALSVPVICIDGRMDAEPVQVCIRSDEEQRGRHLAERIRQEHPEAKTYILTDGRNPRRDDKICQAMKEELSEKSVEICSWDGSGTLPLEASGQEAVIVALSPRLTELAVQENLEELPLYGLGYTKSILYHMDQGNIQAINVHRDFYMGWTAIQYAFKILDEESYENEVLLEDYTIGNDEMFEREYQDLLFYMS